MFDKILDAIIPLTGLVWMFGKYFKEKQLYMLVSGSLMTVLFLSRWPCDLIMPFPLIICSFVSAFFLIYETKKLKKKGFLTGYLYAIMLIAMGIALLGMCFV